MKHNFRVDFQFVNVGTEADTEIVAIPDPDRYEFTNVDGQGGWFDRLDGRGFCFSVDAIHELLEKASDLPVGDISALITDAPAYIRSRVSAIANALRHGIADLTLKNITNDELADLAGSDEYFVIGSIDLVGSTKSSETIDRKQWVRVIQTYSREVARMCALFHGRPLKFMADGAILYFPLGSSLRRHDLASDCALSLRDLVLLGINPALEELGLPQIACRIGLDSGEASIVTIGDSGTTNQIDLIGHVIDMATKIEKLAGDNEICVGQAAVRRMHTMWLKHVAKVAPPPDWPYRDQTTGEPYGIHRLEIPADNE
jgi:class 3 adenylate cyclase